MRAVVMQVTGGPEVLAVTEVADPRPKPGEVLVEASACGICGHDQADRRGLTRIPLPAILGHEIAGTVAELGEGVSGWSVGQRVAASPFITCGACRACRSGRDQFCPERRFLYGGFAELIAVPASCLVQVPDSVDFCQASVVGCALSTVLHALRRGGDVRPGDSVVVTGASGGLGTLALQVVRALGATPIATTRSPAKAEMLRKAGAEHVVLVDEGDFWNSIRDVTDGAGADVVLDNVGQAAAFPGLLRSLGPCGRYVMTGQLNREKVAMYPRFVFSKELIITGAAGSPMATLRDAMDLVAQRRVKPLVKQYALGQVADAFAEFDAGGRVGRTVLSPPLTSI
jgi:acryloyl-coenzyme A reductase